MVEIILSSHVNLKKTNGQFTFCSTLEETIQKHDGEISDSESDGEMVPVPVDEKPKEKWDCESILVRPT